MIQHISFLVESRFSNKQRYFDLKNQMLDLPLILQDSVIREAKEYDFYTTNLQIDINFFVKIVRLTGYKTI